MTIQVVCGILVKHGRVLLTQRNYEPKWSWGCPGGKVESKDRSHIAALHRELWEEVGVRLSADYDAEPICGTFVNGGDYCVHFFLVGADDFDGEPYGREKQGIGWFTVDQMWEFARTESLTPANGICVASIAAAVQGSR